MNGFPGSPTSGSLSLKSQQDIDALATTIHSAFRSNTAVTSISHGMFGAHCAATIVEEAKSMNDQIRLSTKLSLLVIAVVTRSNFTRADPLLGPLRSPLRCLTPTPRYTHPLGSQS